LLSKRINEEKLESLMPAKIEPYQRAAYLINQLKTNHNIINPIATAQKAINISVPINKPF
jgi:hypothetical protein